MKTLINFIWAWCCLKQTPIGKNIMLTFYYVSKKIGNTSSSFQTVSKT